MTAYDLDKASPDSDDGAPPAELYRRRAQRLLLLAGAAVAPETRHELLDLAQAYEALAEHADRRTA